MTLQTTLNFESKSPINKDKLTGQNKLLYSILQGRTITRIQAQEYGIMCLNSRISDLRNEVGIVVYDRFITTKVGTKLKEYSLTPFL